LHDYCGINKKSFCNKNQGKVTSKPDHLYSLYVAEIDLIDIIVTQGS